MNWKPPSIVERCNAYARHREGMSDEEKLKWFDNIVGAAFRKGYNVRKGDERKIRGNLPNKETYAGICDSIEARAVKRMGDDIKQNEQFWNGVAAGAGQCASVIRGEIGCED